jgi:RimJ/RimL family protein N-acetyltransferase
VIPYVFSTPLTTERLTLRIMTLDDAEAVHSYQSLDEVARYELYEPRDLATVTEKVAKWQHARSLENDGDYIQFAIVRRDSGEMIGEIYFTIKSVANQNAEIGWTVSPRHQGQGFATEAARAALALAFGVMKLHRVSADLDPRNAASVALCTRLGMRLEAHFVEDLWFKGDWGDTSIYSILDREWASS